MILSLILLSQFTNCQKCFIIPWYHFGIYIQVVRPILLVTHQFQLKGVYFSAMKFSQKKKAKMRKCNQRRINRVCKNMIGCTIDYERGYVVKDQAKINNIMYLLVQVENGQYAIYKIVKVCEYVRLSPKKVLSNQKAFSNYAYWYDNSTIQISPKGNIESVKRTVRRVQWKKDRPVYILVIEG